MKSITSLLRKTTFLVFLSYSCPAQEKGEEMQSKILTILSDKCNVCHSKQNPRKVFNDSNVYIYAPEIWKQVFIKKRMPRGKKIVLTALEKDMLQTWLQKQLVTK